MINLSRKLPPESSVTHPAVARRRTRVQRSAPRNKCPAACRPRCRDCGPTQVLLPTELTVRRADTTEAIGNALVAKANNAGHRTIAADLDRPQSTVRRWPAAPAQWLYQQGVQKIVTIDRDLHTRLAPQRTHSGGR